MQRRNVVLLTVLAYILGVSSPYVSLWGFKRFVQPKFGGHDEVGRLTSPDGVIDAVVMRVNPGAFSSFLYNLYLVPKGTRKIEGVEAPILSTSGGDAPTVRWDKSHFLTVDTDDSQIMSFGNLWYSQKVNDYYVELSLLPASGKHYLRDDGRLHGE